MVAHVDIAEKSNRPVLVVVHLVVVVVVSRLVQVVVALEVVHKAVSPLVETLATTATKVELSALKVRPAQSY